MKNLAIVIALCLLGAVGCAKGGGGGSSDNTSTKSFFSSWTRNDGQISVDFTGGSFGPTYMFQFVLLATGETCRCTSVVFSGAETAGSIAVSGCSHFAGPNGGSCSAFNNGGSPYTYVKSGSALTLCDSGSCGTYN